MATAGQRAFATTDSLMLPVPSGTVKGDAVAFGRLVGVAMTDRNSDGIATVQCQPVNVFWLNVTGADDIDSPISGAAISAGDDVYLKEATGEISADDGGTLFGIALDAVGSGDTDVARVIVLP